MSSMCGRVAAATVLGAVTLAAAGGTTAHAACTDKVSSAASFRRGKDFVAHYTVCHTGTAKVGLVRLGQQNRGGLALHRTVKVTKAGPGTVTTTVGATAIGRYRLVLITPSGRHVSGNIVHILDNGY